MTTKPSPFFSLRSASTIKASIESSDVEVATQISEQPLQQAQQETISQTQGKSQVTPTPSEDSAPSAESVFVQALLEEGMRPTHIDIVKKRKAKTHETITEIMRSSEYGFLMPEAIARVIAKVSALEYFAPAQIDQIDATKIEAFLKASGLTVSQKFQGVLPVEVIGEGANQTLVCALSEPMARNDGERLFRGRPKIYKIASERTLQTLYRRYYASTGNVVMDLQDQLLSAIDDGNSDSEGSADQNLLRRFILSIMRHACYSGASDIGFSPSASNSGGDVRIKIDGVGQILTFLPSALWNMVINYLSSEMAAADKLASLGTVDRRFIFKPEDEVEFSELSGRYAFRVVFLQRTENSTGLITVVMRVLDQQADTAELETLNFDKESLRYIRDVKERSTGLFLVTGPTGSGKTTSLYAILKEIDPIARWVETIENPIEYSSGLWMQFQTRQAQHKTDGVASDEAHGADQLLKGLLRAAPNVILVGEIRDAAIAQTLVDAGNTGHLVFTTLHTNNAALAINRIKNFGVDMSAIASLLLGVLAQRLVRTLCTCAVDDTRVETLTTLSNLPYLDEARLGHPLRPRRAYGCVNCHSTGYRGRRMVYELLQINAKVRELIESGASPRMIAKEGIHAEGTLVANGLRLVAAGLTSIDEIKKLGSLKDGD